MSFAQERIWFWDQLEPQSALYNVPVGLRIRGPLDVGALEKSLNAVIERHEALRTNFISEGGMPLQVVGKHRPVELQMKDMSRLNANDREVQTRLATGESARHPFDLSSGVMIRPALFRLANDEHILLLTAHHIAFDFLSAKVLFRELSQAYVAYSNGNPFVLPDLHIQYSDFSIWQRQWLQGEVLESLLAFWKDQLAGYPESNYLIPDRPRPARRTYRGARVETILDKALIASLTQLSRPKGVTLFMTLLAGFQTLLHRYSGHDEIVTGFPIANRNRPEVSHLIGFFANTLILRSDLSDNPKFNDFLLSTRERALETYLHQYLPFEKIVEVLQPNRALGQSPLFQVMFVFQNVPTPVPEWPGLSVTPYEVETGTAKFDLTVLIEPREESFRVALEYDTDLFEAGAMQRLLGHYRSLLEAAAANPESRIASLPLLTERESRQVLVEWNDTRREFPKACVHELLEAQAGKTPDSVALVSGERRVTYAELNRRANQVARHLRNLGVRERVRVGVCLDRSPEQIIALLGILKAGGTYVPVDPEEPSERLAFMLSDSEAQVLVAERQVGPLPLYCAHVVKISDLLDSETALEGANVTGTTTPESPAYVMYTSGSTGRPKGVEILHRGIVRLVFAQDYASMTEKEVFLHLAPSSFDASTFEIWAPLLHGARAVLYPGKLPGVEELGELLRTHGVTTLWLTSTLFNTVIDEAPQSLASIQQLFVGGEALSVPHIRRAVQALPGVKITNGYGPTECTTFSCTYPISRDIPESLSSIPIGRPIANTKVYVLDRYLAPLPVGVAGELYIGGPGLASGYINQPELSAERFISSPFDHGSGERLYKTGDLVRYLPDGNLEFLGRKDRQVKLRGLRIELGEIEAALAQHPCLKTATVMVGEDGATGKYLVAYAVPRDGEPPDSRELQTFLKQKVPDYMVPSRWMFLDMLPRLSSGKVDRRGLAAMKPGTFIRSQEFIAPRDAVELRMARIWEDILNRQPIGIRDNFFDLGGHSLLAVRVVAAIERAFGKKLHLSALMSAPTIEQLSASLKSVNDSLGSSIVPIQPNGTRPPLFCVHGGGGHVLRFHDLALELGADQPFYGLRSPEFNGTTNEITVEHLAETYLREIRVVQSEGPYYLAGASFGGLVAYEIANRLCAQGEPVALLALFDTFNPAILKSLPPQEAKLYRRTRLLERLNHHYALFGRGAAAERLRAGMTLLKAIRSHISFLLWQVTFDVCQRTHRPLPSRLRDNLKLFTMATRRYDPKPYPGRVVLFRAAEQKALFGPDPALGWGLVARRGVEIYEVPGDHITILDRPRVAKLAERLRILLNEPETNNVNQHKAIRPVLAGHPEADDGRGSRERLREMATRLADSQSGSG